MYPNVRAEMARRNLSTLELSKKTGIPNTTLSDKLKGKTKITLDDAIAIRDALEVEMSIEELFEKEAV